MNPDDLLETMVTRRSIRKYRDTEVEWDKIGTIFEAAKWAPSAGNCQNWKYILVTEVNQRKQVAEACLRQWWMQTAPVHIVAVSETFKVEQFYGIRGERLYAIQNVAAGIQNIMLMAHALGLGSCWIGAFDEEKLKSTCKIPDHVRPQAVITIGYPDEHVEPPIRLTLEDVMYFRGYGGQIHKISDIDRILGHTRQHIEKAFSIVKNLVNKFIKKEKQ